MGRAQQKRSRVAPQNDHRRDEDDRREREERKRRRGEVAEGRVRADSLAGLVGAIIMNTSEATEMNTTGSGKEVAAADVPRQDDAVSRLTPSKDAAADDVPRRDDAVLRLEQRMDLMEARFQREISDVKRVSVDLLTKNTRITAVFHA